MEKKKTGVKKIFSMLLAVCCLLSLWTPVKALAATTDISNIVQVSATKNTAQIFIQSKLNSLGSEWQYYVEASVDAKSGFAKYAETETSMCDLTGLAAGTRYYVRVTPYKKDDAGAITYGATSDVTEIVTAPGSKPANIRLTGTTSDSMSLAWDKQNGVDGYYVDYEVSGTEQIGTGLKSQITTQANACTLTGMLVNKVYSITITPYCTGKNNFIACDETAAVTLSTQFQPALNQIQMITQTGATTGSVQISFGALNQQKISYGIWLSETANGNYRKVGDTTENSYVIGSAQTDATLTGSSLQVTLAPGKSYYVKVIPHYTGAAEDSTDVAEWESGQSVVPFEVVTVPERAAGVKQEMAKLSAIRVSWNAVTGASGYYVDYCKSGSDAMIKSKMNVTTNKITLKDLQKNGEYTIYITSYRKSASGYVACDENSYTYKCNIPVKPQKATAPKVNQYWSSIAKINVSTKPVACADGYEYQVWTAYEKNNRKIATKHAPSYQSTNITKSRLTYARTYKVRVRAYVEVEGKKVYGEWSGFTYCSKAPDLTLKKQNGGIQANWEKIKGADRYVVYISDSYTGGFKKTIVTTKTSGTITKYAGKNLKKNANYYIYVMPQKRVGNNYQSLTCDKTATKIKFK